jgi:hypothetical protein
MEDACWIDSYHCRFYRGCRCIAAGCCRLCTHSRGGICSCVQSVVGVFVINKEAIASVRIHALPDLPRHFRRWWLKRRKVRGDWQIHSPKLSLERPKFPANMTCETEGAEEMCVWVGGEGGYEEEKRCERSSSQRWLETPYRALSLSLLGRSMKLKREWGGGLTILDLRQPSWLEPLHRDLRSLCTGSAGPRSLADRPADRPGVHAHLLSLEIRSSHLNQRSRIGALTSPNCEPQSWLWCCRWAFDANKGEKAMRGQTMTSSRQQRASHTTREGCTCKHIMGRQQRPCLPRTRYRTRKSGCSRGTWA